MKGDWENWTAEYSEIDKDELIEKMNAAFRKMTWHPPLSLGPVAKMRESFWHIEHLLRRLE